MKVLLGQLEELAWNLPPGPLGPTPDLFGDGERPRSGEDSSGWGRLPATAQVWPGRAGTGLGSSWGGVGRHPPTHTHTQSVLCPYPRLGALQPGIWSGLLEGLAQFTWLPPGTALAVYTPPPPKLLGSFQVPCKEPVLRHHRAPYSLPVPCVPWPGRSRGLGGEGRAGACSTPSCPSLSDGFGAPEPALPSSWK